VINFLNFTFSALLGPVFGARLMVPPGQDDVSAMARYQAGFTPLIYGIAIALILTCFLKETGPAVKKQSAAGSLGYPISNPQLLNAYEIEGNQNSICRCLAFRGESAALAQSSEIEELKAKMKSMEQTLNETKQRLADLEKGQTGAVVKTTNDLGIIVFHFPTAQVEGHPSPVAPRNALNDQQEAAQRPNNLTLDPKYNWFHSRPQHAGPRKIQRQAAPRRLCRQSKSRKRRSFRSCTIPLRNDPLHGGGAHFNMNAKGSQLSLDVRAPELPGDLRFLLQ
jgi:hypothetical protein